MFCTLGCDILLQEFDLEIRDKKGVEIFVVDHLSCLHFEESDELPINQYLRVDTLLKVSTTGPWYANIVNYIVASYIPPGVDRKNLIRDSRVHLWDDPYLYRVCVDGLLRRRVPAYERRKIIEHCHASPYGSHYGAFRTYAKVWQSGFYWPTMYEDAKYFVQHCITYQKHRNLNARDAMPLKTHL